MNNVTGSADKIKSCIQMDPPDYLRRCHTNYRKQIHSGKLERWQEAERLIALERDGLMWGDIPPDYGEKYGLPHLHDYGVDVTDLALTFASQVKCYGPKSKITWRAYSTFSTYSEKCLNIPTSKLYLDTTHEAGIDSLVQSVIDKGHGQLTRHDFDTLRQKYSEGARDTECESVTVTPVTTLHLRPPQQEALIILEQSLPGSVIRIQMPPGVGKTHVALTYIQRHPEAVHLFIAPPTDLAYATTQAAERLGISVQFLGDSGSDLRLDSLTPGSLVVCITASMHRLPKDFQWGIKVLDEAHHLETEEASRRCQADSIMAERTLEMSATFSDQTTLDFNFPMEQAIVEGYICDYKMHFGIFEEGMNRIRATQTLIKKHLVEWSPMLVYFNSTESVEKARDAFAESGISARSLTGTSGQVERDEVALGIQEGRVDVVCLCGVWNESVSHHAVRTVIFAEPRHSATNKVQVSCRANRLHPTKAFYNIVFPCREVDMETDAVHKLIRSFAVWDGRLARAVRNRDGIRLGVERVMEVESDSDSDSDDKMGEAELLYETVFDRLGQMMTHYPFYESFNKLKEYAVDQPEYPPSTIDPDPDTKKMGSFLSNQKANYANNKNIMKYPEIKTEWESFMKEVPAYFKTNTVKWLDNLCITIEYIKTHKSWPGFAVDTPQDIVFMSKWLGTQTGAYKKKSTPMNDPTIRSKWEEFMSEYGKYKIDNKTKFMRNLDKFDNWCTTNKRLPTGSAEDKKNLEIYSHALFYTRNKKDYNNNTGLFTNPEIRSKWEEVIHKHSDKMPESWLDKLHWNQEYIDTKKKPATKHNKDKDVKKYGIWLGNQPRNYHNKVADSDLMKTYLTQWEEFYNKNQEYLTDTPSKIKYWHSMLEKVIIFIETHHRRPRLGVNRTRIASSDEDKLANWLCKYTRTQQKNSTWLDKPEIKPTWQNFTNNYHKVL